MEYLDVYGNKRKSHKPLIRFWIMWFLATFNVVSDGLFISTLIARPCEQFNGSVTKCDPDAPANAVKGRFTRAHFARCVQNNCLSLVQECADVAHCYGESAYGCLTTGLGMSVIGAAEECIQMPSGNDCLAPPLCKGHRRCDVEPKLKLHEQDSSVECKAVGMDYWGAGLSLIVFISLKELFKGFSVMVLFFLTVYHKVGNRMGWHVRKSDTDLTEVASLSFNSPLAIILAIDKPTFLKFIKEASRDSVEMIVADLLLEDIPASVISAVFMFEVGVQAYPMLSLLSSALSFSWIVYRMVLRRRYSAERKEQRQRREDAAKNGTFNREGDDPYEETRPLRPDL